MDEKKSPCDRSCLLFIGSAENETKIRCCRSGTFKNRKRLRRGAGCKHKVRAQERFDQTGSYL